MARIGYRALRKYGPKLTIFERRNMSRFYKDGVFQIDYKDPDMLKHFKTERGKILPRRITGLSAKDQRRIRKAIKRARNAGLMPFVSSTLAD